MSDFDDAFHVMEDSRWKRFKRDVKLARWLLLFLAFYTIKGGKIRRRYLKHKAAGTPYYID